MTYDQGLDKLIDPTVTGLGQLRQVQRGLLLCQASHAGWCNRRSGVERAGSSHPTSPFAHTKSR